MCVGGCERGSVCMEGGVSMLVHVWRICEFVCLRLYTYMHTHIYMCLCVCVCTYICMCMLEYACVIIFARFI